MSKVYNFDLTIEFLKSWRWDIVSKWAGECPVPTPEDLETVAKIQLALAAIKDAAGPIAEANDIGVQ
ncbi:hypothetical protein ACSSV1_000189 [Labrenzia sp. MBR-25]